MSAKDWTGNKQSVMATLNASCLSTKNRAENDYYATPRKAVELLLEKESFMNVWEPACGEGHISKVLKENGIRVNSSDKIDRGYGKVIDFLECEGITSGDIVTNPPFSLSTEFVYKAMEILQNNCKLALLLRIQFLESVKRYELFKIHPPKKIYVFSRNIRCAKNGDFSNATGNASTYAWFLWEKSFKGLPSVDWLI